MTRHDDDRRILEVSYRESPANTPSIIWEAIVPSLLIAGGVYALVRALTLPPYQLAQFTGAIFGVVMLMWRLYEWDESGRPVHVTEHTRHIEDPKPRLRPIVGSSDAQHLTVGRWRFKEAEWVRLGRVLATGKLTREPLRDLQLENGEPMWPTLNERYPSIVEEFHRIGWVDSENTVTNAARAWYEDHGLTFAAPLPGDGR